MCNLEALRSGQLNRRIINGKFNSLQMFKTMPTNKSSLNKAVSKT